MENKYFFSKCGGKNCNFHFPLHDGGIDFICTVDRKESPDCENCPHGKTLSELADVMQDGTDNIPQSLINTTISNGETSIKIKMIDLFIYGLKALLDSGGTK